MQAESRRPIFHDFRRTAVRNLERAGVSRSVAMKMVGHKTEAIYRRYAIVSEADLREASRKLEAVIGPRPLSLDPWRRTIHAARVPGRYRMHAPSATDER